MSALVRKSTQVWQLQSEKRHILQPKQTHLVQPLHIVSLQHPLARLLLSLSSLSAQVILSTSKTSHKIKSIDGAVIKENKIKFNDNHYHSASNGSLNEIGCHSALALKKIVVRYA